jgi:hypothetical protein
MSDLERYYKLGVTVARAAQRLGVSEPTVAIAFNGFFRRGLPRGPVPRTGNEERGLHYTGADWIGEQITIPEEPVGPDWIGKRIETPL